MYGPVTTFIEQMQRIDRERRSEANARVEETKWAVLKCETALERHAETCPRCKGFFYSHIIHGKTACIPGFKLALKIRLGYKRLRKST